MTKNGLHEFRVIVKITILAIGCWLISNTSFAQPISSTELINEAKRYDGKIVTYEGEIIGDVMKRGPYAWLNISDGTNAIGIWINSSLIKDIAYTGTYKSKGDKVEITGIFHRACIEHGGDLDIHAQAIRKVASGEQISYNLNLKKLKSIGILLAVVLLLWCLNLLQRK